MLGYWFPSNERYSQRACLSRRIVKCLNMTTTSSFRSDCHEAHLGPLKVNCHNVWMFWVIYAENINRPALVCSIYSLSNGHEYWSMKVFLKDCRRLNCAIIRRYVLQFQDWFEHNQPMLHISRNWGWRLPSLYFEYSQRPCILYVAPQLTSNES